MSATDAPAADRLPDDIEREIVLLCGDCDGRALRCPHADAIRRAILAGMMEAKADGHDTGWNDAIVPEITGTEEMATLLRARAKALREAR